MNENELAELLLMDFCGNFAERTANTVITQGAVEPLYNLAANGYDIALPPSEKNKLMFRAAYILETVYKQYPDYFWPYRERFFADFRKARNGSAKRHYCNIMADILDHETPDAETADAIAEACAGWMSEPKVKAAVKIKGAEILMKLMDGPQWIKETLPVILEDMLGSPQPSMAASVRKWKRKGWLAEIYK